MDDSPAAPVERAAGPAAALRRPPTERELIAQAIAVRLHPAMSVLAVLFLLVALALLIADPGPLQVGLQVAMWLLWAAFVLEFVLRMIIAPSAWRFLRRNWWQAALLLVPFLSFLRIIAFVRLGRAGRILASALRAGRTAGRTFRSRLLWLSAIHAIVILGGGQLAYEFAGYTSLAEALHDVTLLASAGEPLPAAQGIGPLLNVTLAVYSVTIFASLAGTIGAYLLERQAEDSRGAGIG